MGIARDDLQIRTYRTVCQSGYSSAVAIPANTIGHLTSIEVESSTISGLVLPALTLQITDTFSPVGNGGADSSSRTISRKQLAILAGDCVHLDTKGDIPLFDNIRVLSNCSGPIVTLGVAMGGV